LDGRWPPMLLEAGQNTDSVRKHDVKQSVRKARDERAPSLAMGRRASERVLSDEVHHKVE